MKSGRVLILMSDTGGGHRSAAKAIAEGLEHIRPGEFDVQLLDFIADCTPFPLNRAGRLYQPAVTYGGPLWGWFWRLNDGHRRMAIILKFFTPWAKGRLTQLLRRTRPQAVVSVHSLSNHLAVQAVSGLDKPIPVITLVTDLVRAYASWFCSGVDLCIVPSDAGRQKALTCGLSPQKVKVVGLPVSLEFGQELGGKSERKEKLGLNPDLPALLLVGGGEGMGKVFPIARAIAEARVPAQLLVVTGRNGSLRRRLERMDWKIPTTVFGFADNMPELMAASDVIITKAGPATISEAIACELPIVISGAIPYQEDLNTAYVVENGVGHWVEEPGEIANLLREWLQPGNGELSQMTRNARRLARPATTLEVARLIAEFC
ncbi:MAG: glycosyltransferase [Anaerolineales bacterium]|nr:glycosyltransferase [Anaerolineales bacterium]